jgi:hypothetical protein
LLDVHLTFESENENALRELRARYAAPEFRRARTAAVKGARASGGARAAGGAQELDLEDRMTQRLLEESRDFLLVHAAALARNGRGVILVGPPFAGKTTLALGLVERGLEFYSDDLAPLLRGQGVLYPYRRAAAIRTKEGGREFREVWMTAEGHKQEPPVPCRLGWVFILGQVPASDVAGDVTGGSTNGGAARWSLILAPGSDDLERDLSACADILIVRRCARSRAVRYDLGPAPGGRATARLRELIARWPDQVIYAGPCPAVARGEGEWTREPALARLTRREAALEILRHTLNRGYGDQLQRLYGTHPHLKAYADILEALEGAACFRVESGRVNSTLDLLLQTINREDPRRALVRSTAA